MNRFMYLLCCAGFLLLNSRILYAQQTRPILSFEPGGAEVCAKALGVRIPRGDSAIEDRSFEYDCANRDIEIEQSEFVRKRWQAADRRMLKRSVVYSTPLSVFDRTICRPRLQNAVVAPVAARLSRVPKPTSRLTSFRWLRDSKKMGCRTFPPTISPKWTLRSMRRTRKH